MPNILLVEDDPALAELIASYLERNSYHVNVISRGDQVRERARLSPPDLVILDLMLPGLDGLQVCRLLRADSATLPILMLTARDDSHDQVLGLEMGADDYVCKPVRPRLLLARIQALLRRSEAPEVTPAAFAKPSTPMPPKPPWRKPRPAASRMRWRVCSFCSDRDTNRSFVGC